MATQRDYEFAEERARFEMGLPTNRSPLTPRPDYDRFAPPTDEEVREALAWRKQQHDEGKCGPYCTHCRRLREAFTHQQNQQP